MGSIDSMDHLGLQLDSSVGLKGNGARMDEKRSLGEEIGRRSFGVMWMDEEERLMQELDDARNAAGSSSPSCKRTKGAGSYGGVDTPGGALVAAILLFVVAAVIIGLFAGE